MTGQHLLAQGGVPAGEGSDIPDEESPAYRAPPRAGLARKGRPRRAAPQERTDKGRPPMSEIAHRSSRDDLPSCSCSPPKGEGAGCRRSIC